MPEHIDEYDGFLSYRVWSDADVAEKIIHMVNSFSGFNAHRGIHVETVILVLVLVSLAELWRLPWLMHRVKLATCASSLPTGPRRPVP